MDKTFFTGSYRKTRFWIYAILTFLLVSRLSIAQVYVTGDEAASFYAGVSEEFRYQIEMAIPEEGIVSPVKSRKLLVLNRHVHNGELRQGHGSIKYANYAIKRLGEKTGAFEAYFTTDTMVFKMEVLREFDAICFNNTAGVLFEDPQLRKNLLEYVFRGGGLVGLHAAAATFVQYPVYDQFPEFGVMLGGYENGGHPWMDHEWISIMVEEPDHPINRVIPFENFDISDEVFQFSEPYTRDNLRILLKIDTARTDFSPERRILPERRADMDLALSWIRKYGRGRVYYSSFGDNPHIFWDIRILQHNLAGIQYAMGDLDASAVPSNALTPAIEAQEKLNWTLGLSAYTFKDKTVFETIELTAALGIMYMGGYSEQTVSEKISKDFDHNLNEDEIAAIRQQLVDAGITLRNYYVHKIPADEVQCRKIFEFASRLGVETIVSEPVPEALDIIEKYCNEYDIRLAIHNHTKKISPDYFDPDKVMEAVKDRSPLIGVCGDMGYWVRAGFDISQALDIVKERLFALHVHDLNELSKKGHDVAWGTGNCDLADIFKKLKDEYKRPLFFGLEYAHDWGKSLPDIKKSKAFFDDISLELTE